MSLFAKERTIYWPDEFSGVVNFLTGKSEAGQQISNPLFKYNTGPIILAGCIGARERRKRDIGSGGRKEINTSTFAMQRVDRYIFLVPLMADPERGAELLNPENEEILISEFQKYVAGGLEILRGEIENSGAMSADIVIQNLVLKQNSEHEGSEELTPLI